MAVTVKSAKEIELMREAGRRLEIVHDEMAKIIRPGISTMEINEKGDKVTEVKRDKGDDATPAMS